MLGLIPNMILKYAEEFAETPRNLLCSDEFQLLWNGLVGRIRHIYNTDDFTQFEKDHLLCLWYFATPVTLLDNLNDHTIQDGIRSGVLFLQRINGTDTFKVIVPPVLASLCSPLFGRDFFINPVDQLSEGGFPKFVLAIHHITYHMMGTQARICCKMASAFNRTARHSDGHLEVLTSLNEIYNGAAFGPQSLLTRPLWIRPDIDLIMMTSTKTTSNPDVYAPYETYDRASGADGLTPHAAEQYKSYVAYSDHGTVDSGALTGTDVVVELNKTFLRSSPQIPSPEYNCLMTVRQVRFVT